jgi:hypothetical protein
VTLTPAGSAVAQIDAAASTCDNTGANTDANGQCTLKFSSATAGAVTGSASATLTLNGTPVLVRTDGSGDNSTVAVKTYVAGSLRWLKHDGNGALLGGAVFTVCRTEDWSSAGSGGYTALGTPVCVDVSDHVSGTDNTNTAVEDRDGTAGEFELGGLILGSTPSRRRPRRPLRPRHQDRERQPVDDGDAERHLRERLREHRADRVHHDHPEHATNAVGDAHTFTATMTVDPKGGPRR